MAPKVGVAGVAPEVGEKAPLCTPLCTLLVAELHKKVLKMQELKLDRSKEQT